MTFEASTPVWKSMLRGLMSTRCASFAISRSKPGIMLSIACSRGGVKSGQTRMVL